MRQPHREEHNDAHEAELDRDSERLIVWVRGDELRKGAGSCVALEQLWNRPGAMADEGRLGDEGERLLPVFDAKPCRAVDLPGLISLHLLHRTRDALAQIG